MATGSPFPIFIRPELQDDSPAFAEFTRRAASASKQAAASFRSDFTEITSVISNALTKGMQGGKLNLDVTQLRQAAAEAKLFGTAINETLLASQRLAKETGDISGETRQFIMAMEAAARAQDENRRGIDAQIATYSRLQSALDTTADKNSQLAQSYRETFAEAAKMAQVEVANGRLGALISPALGGSATSRGAGYSALAELARQQDETDKLARASEQLALELDALRRAEVGVAEGAKIVDSVYRGTATSLDAATRSARESAAVFEQLFAAQAEVNGRRFEAFVAPSASISALSNGAGYGELEQAARAADAYERQLAELRQQVDPLAFEQARVNKEMAFAADAFRRGDISADQLASRNQQLTTSLTQMNGGFRESRQGMIMVGQQMQDVAISFLSGQRAGTVLAQQLPQMAFAMSNFGGRVGKVATLLSGPWSLALVAGSFLMGTFIDQLMSSSDAGDAAAKSTYDFTVVLDTRMMTITKFSDAIKQLNENTRGLIDTQALLADSSLGSAKAGVADAEQRIAAIDRQLKSLGSGSTGALSAIPGFGEDPATTARRDALQAQRRVLQANLLAAQNSRSQAEMAIAQRGVDEAVDKAKGIKDSFDRQIAELRQLRLDSAAADAADPATAFGKRQDLGSRYVSQTEFDRRYGELRRNQDKALDTQRKLDRAEKSTATPPVTLREVTALISGQLGGQITSTTGGRHTKGSYHYSGQAVDFVPKGGMGALTKDQIREAFGAAGIGIKELLGPGDKDHDDHFHVAFAKRRKSVEQVQDAMRRMEEASQRAAEKMQREIDGSAEAVASLRGQFDIAPRDIDRAANAVIDLNQAIDDADKKLKAGGLTDTQRKVVETTKSRAEQTRDVLIPDFLKRPLTDNIATTKDLIAAQSLLVQGRTAEYERMQDSLGLARLLGAESLDQLDTQIKARGISQDQLATYYEQSRALRRQSIQLEYQQQQQQVLLQTVEDIESASKNAIFDLLDSKGLGAAKSFISDLYDTTKRQMTEEIFTAVFGDAFQKQKLKILGLDQVDETGKAMASAMRVTIDPIRDLGNAAAQAARQIAGSAFVANDNAVMNKVSNSLPGLPSLGGKNSGGFNVFNDDIVVNGYRSIDNMGSELKTLNKTAADGFGKNGALAKSLAGMGEAFSGAMRGAAIGEATSGVLKSLGIKQSKTGAQIGGAIGSLTGLPGADIVGALIGGTVGGMLKKNKWGTAVVGSDGPASGNKGS